MIDRKKKHDVFVWFVERLIPAGERRNSFIFQFCPFSGICICVCMVHSGFRTFICQVQFSGDSLSELRFSVLFQMDVNVLRSGFR